MESLIIGSYDFYVKWYESFLRFIKRVSLIMYDVFVKALGMWTGLNLMDLAAEKRENCFNRHSNTNKHKLSS